VVEIGEECRINRLFLSSSAFTRVQPRLNVFEQNEPVLAHGRG